MSATFEFLLLFFIFFGIGYAVAKIRDEGKRVDTFLEDLQKWEANNKNRKSD